MNKVTIFESVLILFIVVWHPYLNIQNEWKSKKIFKIMVSLWIIVNIVVLYNLGIFTIVQENLLKVFFIYSTLKILIFSDLLIVLFVGCYYFKNCSFFLNQILPIIKIANILETMHIFSLIVTSNEITEAKNEICYFVYLFAFNVVLFCIDEFHYMEVKPKQKLKYDEDFRTRDIQKREVINVINSYTGTEQIMMLISDKWGGGKTYFVNQIVNQMRKNPKFYIIKMDTLDMSSKEVFLSNMFAKILRKLKKDRFFGGIKDIDRYFEMVLRVVLGETVVGLIQSPFNNFFGITNHKILSLSEGTNKFSEILGNHNLLIVIDNIDCCAKETASEVISLFNNILLLPKSIIIILADQEQLIKKEIVKSDEVYNYFTHIYYLNRIPYVELIKNMQNNFNRDIGDWKYKDIDKIIIDRIKVLKNEIEDTKRFCDLDYAAIEGSKVRETALEEAEKFLSVIDQGTKELEERLSNAKTIQKIYQEIYDKIIVLRNMIEEEKWEYIKIRDFIENVFIPASTFFSLMNQLCSQCFAIKASEIRENKNYKQNLLDVDNNIEEIICAVIEYSFFIKKGELVTYNAADFGEYYFSEDMKLYVINKINAEQ